MSEPPETLQVLKKCPICCNEVKDIAINNSEVLEMCINTKCIYPFSKAGTMSIKRLDNGVESETVEQYTAPAACQPDTLDLQQFLEELTCTDNPQEVSKDVSDIISELMNASPMLQDNG